jgi:hypothetical protein
MRRSAVELLLVSGRTVLLNFEGGTARRKKSCES